MLKEYELKGKEFGLSHKGDYLKLLLLFSIIPVIIIFIGSLLSLLFAALVSVLFDNPELVPLVEASLSLLTKLISCLITVPLAWYGMEMLTSTEDPFIKRVLRCFERFSLNSVLVSIETTFYITLPIILAVGFNNHIKDSAFGLLYSKFGMMIPVLCDSLVLIIISFAVYQSFILSFKYFLVPFILTLDPETSGKEARKRSSFMMLGHLNEFIELYSKLGLLFLISLLFIIPLFWFIPYAYATITYYALDRLEYGGYVSFAEVELES